MAKRKAHSEVRWVMKYRREDDGAYWFGSMMSGSKSALPTMGSGKPCQIRVTEILPPRKGKKR